MKPTSFKKGGCLPPIRYRTPSPPRSAYEPISPTTPPPFERGIERIGVPPHSLNGLRVNSIQSTGLRQECADLSRKHSAEYHNTMDTFASIALATTRDSSSKSRRHPTTSGQHSSGFEDCEERPSKRARSEKLPSPEWTVRRSSAGARPVTSYESLPDNRTMEAELLLNFSQAARSSVPYGVPQNEAWELCTGMPLLPESQASPAQEGYLWGSSYNSAAYVDEQGRRNTNMSMYTTQYMGSAPQSQVHEDTVEKSAEAAKTVDHGFLQSDIRHQLFQASEQTTHNAYIATSDPPSKPSVKQSHQCLDSRSLGTSESPKNKILNHGTTTDPVPGGRVNYLNTTPETQNPFQIYWRPANQSAQQEKNCQTSYLSPTSYRPSMLATTIGPPLSTTYNIVPRSLEDFEDKRSSIREENIPKTASEAEMKFCPSPAPAICAACKFTRNSMNMENESDLTSWISCDGCKLWFHFACAGFKSEREVRSVDKYRCRNCKHSHGPTTYVRKSSRAHTAIDYAGLNQGVIKTSDERPEHHYIKPIKDGTIVFQPETFARIRPELVTAEYFEKGSGMKEPIIIPAHFNLQSQQIACAESAPENQSHTQAEGSCNETILEDWFSHDPESRNIVDQGQDALDMVIPRNLTVRKVAELYGPEEKVEVIDVKSQNGEGRKWNMKRWADYYENSSNKAVRNVISLEVSQSKLGRLIRRPQIVRDLDLQNAVWPTELQARGEYPRVQFYCLMSVADCFTDFHIDFGGSSVFYHILKGKKTFFFIPPKEKHLKKYEEWCMSPAQNWTFLADQTKECYRVDLEEGDTMLIPAGWIHAVWTPEDSLVIGGNFLTRMQYSMQLRIAQIEKVTGVARKFRYPHFQKIQWYAALRYLEDDPLPSGVSESLEVGGIFHRSFPAYHDFDAWGENSRSGPENYQARYYSQPELEGLPDLTRYLLRTALIDSGAITEGVTAETRNAVKKSIPRGFGDPLEIVKKFAMWSAWKRGNEPIPHWAYANATTDFTFAQTAAKPNAAAVKKSDQESTSQTPRRQSARHHPQPLPAPSGESRLNIEELSHERDALADSSEKLEPGLRGDLGELSLSSKRDSTGGRNRVLVGTSNAVGPRKQKATSRSKIGSHRKTACESCRRRRRACRHTIDQVFKTANPDAISDSTTPCHELLVNEPSTTAIASSQSFEGNPKSSDNKGDEQGGLNFCHVEVTQKIDGTSDIGSRPSNVPDDNSLDDDLETPAQVVYDEKVHVGNDVVRAVGENVCQAPLNVQSIRGRSKACNDCRKSKVSVFTIMLPDVVADPWFSAAAFIMRMAMKILSRLDKLLFRGLLSLQSGESFRPTAKKLLRTTGQKYVHYRSIRC